MLTALETSTAISLQLFLFVEVFSSGFERLHISVDLWMWMQEFASKERTKTINSYYTQLYFGLNLQEALINFLVRGIDLSPPT